MNQASTTLAPCNEPCHTTPFDSCMKALFLKIKKSLLFLGLLGIAACDTAGITPEPPAYTISMSTEEYPSDMARSWVNLLCRVVKTTEGYYPPMAARAFGYMGVTLYEAVQPGIQGSKSLSTVLNQYDASKHPKMDATKEYNWALSANAAMAQQMRNFFKNINPRNLASVDSLEAYNVKVYETNEKKEVVDNSIAFGKSIAAAIFEYAKTDGGHEAYLNPFTSFNPSPGPHVWEPTGSGPAMGSTWGNNRTMLAVNNTVAPPDPIAFSSDPNSPMYQMALEVYQQVKEKNTPDQIEIAKFWADDPFATCTPTGHTFSILTQLLGDTHASLAKAAVAYVRMSIAENDAFIICWRAKFKYNLMRPFTYIRRFIDPSFETVIDTPPFPAYTSGHSTEAGAASRIFTATFGANHAFTDRTQIFFGFSRTQRSYTSFEQVANESGFSRLYAGIHYRMDIEQGLATGKQLGNNVVALNFAPVNL